MSTIPNYELQAKITSWRLRAAAGELTLDEMKEAVKALRAGRVSAASASAASASKRSKSIAAIPSAEDLLAELDSM